MPLLTPCDLTEFWLASHLDYLSEGVSGCELRALRPFREFANSFKTVQFCNGLHHDHQGLCGQCNPSYPTLHP